MEEAVSFPATSSSSASSLFQGLRGPGDDRKPSAGSEGSMGRRRSSDGDTEEETDDEEEDGEDEGWLSQVEMVTYEGPHRRLWYVGCMLMG